MKTNQLKTKTQSAGGSHVFGSAVTLTQRPTLPKPQVNYEKILIQSLTRLFMGIGWSNEQIVRYCPTMFQWITVLFESICFLTIGFCAGYIKVSVTFILCFALIRLGHGEHFKGVGICLFTTALALLPALYFAQFGYMYALITVLLVSILFRNDVSIG